MTPAEPRREADGRRARLLQDVPLRVLLVGGFLLSGLIPLMILSLASYRTAHEELTRQAFRQLEAVRDIKRQQVMNYFQERFADLRAFSAMPSLKLACRELTAAQRAGRADAAGNLRERHEIHLRTLLGQYDGFAGLALVDCASGDVLLASDREQPAGVAAARPLPPAIWREALRGDQVVLTDIGRCGADGREVCQYLAAALGGGPKAQCVLVARLALEAVDRIMKERSGMGQSGETYLVGDDLRMRSDSHLDPERHSLRASLSGSVAVNGADTEGVRRALSGEAGTALIRDYRGVVVLSAFAPLVIEKLAWVIAAEIDLAEIDQQIRRALNPQVLIITGSAALLVLILALVIAHFIGRNINRVVGQIRSLIECVLQDRTDERIDLQQTGVDFRAVSARVNQLVVAFQDHVARIRRLEEHQRFTQKIEAIGTLAGGVAHDFNNVLTYLLAYTRLAMTDLPANAPARDSLREVITGIHRAGELIRRILPAPYPDRSDPQQADARAICQETIAILKATLPGTISVQGELGERALLVNCAPVPFQQMLMNLCINAYHAMQDKGGVLAISLSRLAVSAAEGGMPAWVRLIVRDSGCGMSAGVRARLFEPLFTTKPAGVGSGLGLTMVKETVQACGGRIDVASELGIGSEFAIDLPLAVDPPEASAAAAVPSVTKGPWRILLIDDDERVRRSQARLLEELGFQVDLAEDAKEALRLIHNAPGRWQLVVTDFDLPGINGIELAGQLRLSDPQLPVFLMTGHFELLQKTDPHAAGIRAVLTKPFDMAELCDALRTIAAV
jgi:signal transduction histidine kinase